MRLLVSLGVVVLSVGLSLGICGCGSGNSLHSFNCTASIEPALIVYVTDAVTGATATVTDGSYMETLNPSYFHTATSDPSSDLVPVAFGEARERVGTYTHYSTWLCIRRAKRHQGNKGGLPRKHAL